MALYCVLLWKRLQWAPVQPRHSADLPWSLLLSTCYTDNRKSPLNSTDHLVHLCVHTESVNCPALMWPLVNGVNSGGWWLMCLLGLCLLYSWWEQLFPWWENIHSHLGNRSGLQRITKNQQWLDLSIGVCWLPLWIQCIVGFLVSWDLPCTRVPLLHGMYSPGSAHPVPDSQSIPPRSSESLLASVSTSRS